MAVFYRTSSGVVKFTEWEGTWLNGPVSLGQPSDGKASIPIASELNAVSRTTIIRPCLGWMLVEGYGTWNAPTRMSWIGAIRPGSSCSMGRRWRNLRLPRRHANHIGVVVRDNAGRPFYSRWSWVTPKNFTCPWWGRPSTGVNFTAPEDDLKSAIIRDCFGPSGLVAALPTGGLPSLPRS